MTGSEPKGAGEESFDPNAPADPSAGVFGLDQSAEDADLWLIPVPFAATVSYRRGAQEGPEAILAASHQVDLFDLQTGKPYQRGIWMLPIPGEIVELDGGGRLAVEAGDMARVDAAGERVNQWVREQADAAFDAGKLCGVVGGDHSVAFGAIQAAADRQERLGVLQIDAHADLRVAYQGYRFSHASIFDNVLREIPGVVRVEQVGVRDFCEQEAEAIRAAGDRVRCWFDWEWKTRLADGETLRALCDEVVAGLPAEIWVSLDIDGLDPTLCPNTGTPVPGGLSFHEVCELLGAIHRSGKRLVGFDLCEVSPGTFGDEWDANVGARVLYKLCGFTLLAN